MAETLVSIIIPCYNQQEFLDECLHSVSVQTYENWECIIIDDGSTDNSQNIAEKWVEKDSRFIYIKIANGGPSLARNTGIEKSTGEWILFLDGDDIIATEKLNHSIKNSENKNIVISNFEMLHNGKVLEPFSDITRYPISTENIVKRWDIDFNIPIHCILFRKELIGNIRYKENLKAKEDWIFWIDIFSKNKIEVRLIDEKLVQYRQHSNGISKNFKSVYIDNQNANEYIYNNYDETIRQALFERINLQNFNLNNENLEQKKYIKQLQNTKVLKYYFKLKKLF